MIRANRKPPAMLRGRTGHLQSDDSRRLSMTGDTFFPESRPPEERPQRRQSRQVIARPSKGFEQRCDRICDLQSPQGGSRTFIWRRLGEYVSRCPRQTTLRCIHYCMVCPYRWPQTNCRSPQLQGALGRHMATESDQQRVSFLLHVWQFVDPSFLGSQRPRSVGLQMMYYGTVVIGSEWRFCVWLGRMGECLDEGKLDSNGVTLEVKRHDPGPKTRWRLRDGMIWSG
jgi:hypothetical protein